MTKEPSEGLVEDKPLSERIRLVRQLISNQYNVVHQTERYVFDLAKIASIILGVISFIGVPNLLAFQSENVWLISFSRGIAVASICYAFICIAVILVGVASMGGITLRMKGRFQPSAWWYTDDRLLEIKKLKNYDDAAKWLSGAIERFEDDMLTGSDQEILVKEETTLLFLYYRNEEQLIWARRLRKVLYSGLFLSFGAFTGAVLSSLGLF